MTAAKNATIGESGALGAGEVGAGEVGAAGGLGARGTWIPIVVGAAVTYLEAKSIFNEKNTPIGKVPKAHLTGASGTAIGAGLTPERGPGQHSGPGAKSVPLDSCGQGCQRTLARGQRAFEPTVGRAQSDEVATRVRLL